MHTFIVDEKLSSVTPVPPVASLSRDLPVADVHESSEMAKELSHSDIADIQSHLQNSGL